MRIAWSMWSVEKDFRPQRIGVPRSQCNLIGIGAAKTRTASELPRSGCSGRPKRSLSDLRRDRIITVYGDSRSDGWRYELWEKDVAEAFLQPESGAPFEYQELEVAPNGMWIDLHISHGK